MGNKPRYKPVANAAYFLAGGFAFFLTSSARGLDRAESIRRANSYSEIGAGSGLGLATITCDYSETIRPLSPLMIPLVSPIPEVEINLIMARTKIWASDLEWSERPNNSRLLQSVATLLDDDGATIPGVTVELRYRHGTVADECKYLFTLFLFRGNRERIYQLEVVPPHQRSHRHEGGEWWYGPHQHFGHRAEKLPDEVTVGCDDHENCFRVFLRLANIQFSGRYLPPVAQLPLGLGR